MAISKNRKGVLENVDLNKSYSLDEASAIVKENSKVKFDASVDLAVRLGVDPRQANQMVRGVASLPHGTGKTLKVLALVSADKEAEAKEAGIKVCDNAEFQHPGEHQSGWFMQLTYHGDGEIEQYGERKPQNTRNSSPQQKQ